MQNPQKVEMIMSLNFGRRSEAKQIKTKLVSSDEMLKLLYQEL